MKKALVVATVVGFISTFEINDILILQEMGYEVHIAANMTYYGNKEKLQRVLSLGVVSHDIKFYRSPFSLGNIKALKKMKELVETEKFDLLHCHTPVGGVIGRVVGYFASIAKIIYTAHGFHFYNGAPIKNWILFYPVEKLLSYCTDVLITINKEDYKRADKNLNAKKTIYIPGVGVDTKKFANCNIDVRIKRQELGVKTDDFVLLSVGELNVNKNHKIVIEALWQMKKEKILSNVVYLIVGAGSLLKEYQCLIQEYNLEKHVKLLGYREDIDELCKTVDCFVHPSLREGLGVAPLEAMASGLPLISSLIGGIRDYTENNVSGCCIDPKSVDAMANAIKKMKNDIRFRRECGRNNKEIAKNFDIEKTNSIMRKVYQEI